MKLHHGLIVLSLGLAACGEQAEGPRLNEIQVFGSHNSYKDQIDPVLFARITATDPATAETLDYWHIPLQGQLDLGLRNLELDVAWDPDGGRYARPLGYEMLKAEGATTLFPHDTAGLETPGWKTLHIQDVDFRTHCPTFEACLADLANWSQANPRHVPVFVTMNLKAGPSPIDGGPAAPEPDLVSLAALDKALVDTLWRDRLFMPDDLRGTAATLPDAIKAGDWPTVAALRGKFIFIIDEHSESLRQHYAGGDHTALKGRAMFQALPAGDPGEAFTVINEPIRDEAAITAALKKGLIIRTRADADTYEARSGDTTRRDAAFASGAQIVTTDYYKPDPRFGTGYAVSLPGGGTIRCNPVTAAEGCEKPVE